MTKIDDSWYERKPEHAERISAGGVVARIERGMVQIALVREKDFGGFVLPKGGVEPGETIEEAAHREIREESGLDSVEFLKHLDTLERCSYEKHLWSVNHYGLYYTEQVKGEILDTANHYDMAWFIIDELPEMFWPDELTLLQAHRKPVYDAVIAHKNPKSRKKYFM